jgi:hypothetical protein
MSCDHKFIDSNRCAKCGVHVEKLRAADASDWEEFVNAPAERELTADELDIEDMVGNMHYRVAGAWALLGGMGDGSGRERVARAYELAPKLYQLIPFLKALGRLALEHPERMRELWAAALVEPMPFGLTLVGMPRVQKERS